MSERVLMKGNEAVSEAAIQAGCRHFFGYPITPQNEVAAYMSERMPQINGTYLQAESEIAAINMVLGASASGVRSMTSSSSPGISLKAEGLSYLAGSDLPCLIVNIQRGGPGLGSIQPAQQDYFQATKAPGHGGFRVLVFAPSTVQEMVDMAFYAFDMAEKFRMPAMLLADGLLGQMMEPVQFPKIDVKPSEKPWAVGPVKGKKGKNFINSLYLQPEKLSAVNTERDERYAKIMRELQDAETYQTEGAEINIVAYGASARIARSAVNNARKAGLKVGLIRPKTLWPFPEKIIQEASKDAKSLLVMELNSGQMVDDVRLAVECRKPVDFFGRTGGIIPTPAEVLDAVKKILGGTK